MEESEDRDDDHFDVSLLFDEPSGIIHNLIGLFNYYAKTIFIQVYPSVSYIQFESSVDQFLDEFLDFQIDYDEQIEENIKNSEMVLFIASNQSVYSEKCTRLLELTRKLKIHTVSVVVEEIPDYSELKSTILSGIDHHIEIYNDRIYDDGYDPYLWLSKHFVNWFERAISKNMCIETYSVTIINSL